MENLPGVRFVLARDWNMNVWIQSGNPRWELVLELMGWTATVSAAPREAKQGNCPQWALPDMSKLLLSKLGAFQGSESALTIPPAVTPQQLCAALFLFGV